MVNKSVLFLTLTFYDSELQGKLTSHEPATHALCVSPRLDCEFIQMSIWDGAFWLDEPSVCHIVSRPVSLLTSRLERRTSCWGDLAHCHSALRCLAKLQSQFRSSEKPLNFALCSRNEEMLFRPDEAAVTAAPSLFTSLQQLSISSRLNRICLSSRLVLLREDADWS